MSFIPYLEVFPRALAQRGDRDQSLGKEIVGSHEEAGGVDPCDPRAHLFALVSASHQAGGEMSHIALRLQGATLGFGTVLPEVVETPQ